MFFFIDSAHPSVQPACELQNGANHLRGGWTMRRATIAVAVLLFGAQAQAGIITQISHFHYADHAGKGAEPYNQLDPSLAPLNAVVLTVSVEGYDHTFQVANPTSNTISFNATLVGDLNSEAGRFTSGSIVPVTLGPHQSTYFVPPLIPLPGFQTTMTLTGDLTGSRYVGTGMLTPPGFGNLESVTADNSLITVTELASTFDLRGTEMITYYYSSSFLNPEPASLVMFALAWPRLPDWRGGGAR
jgi:hypothetical protein